MREYVYIYTCVCVSVSVCACVSEHKYSIRERCVFVTRRLGGHVTGCGMTRRSRASMCTPTRRPAPYGSEDDGIIMVAYQMCSDFDE